MKKVFKLSITGLVLQFGGIIHFIAGVFLPDALLGFLLDGDDIGIVLPNALSILGISLAITSFVLFAVAFNTFKKIETQKQEEDK